MIAPLESSALAYDQRSVLVRGKASIRRGIAALSAKPSPKYALPERPVQPDGVADAGEVLFRRFAS